MSRLDKYGREVLSEDPVAVPVKYTRPPSQYQELKQLLGLANRIAESEGLETFEEADDFDVPDELPVDSPWELVFDPVSNREMPQEMYAELKKDRDNFDRIAEKQRKKSLRERFFGRSSDKNLSDEKPRSVPADQPKVEE